MTQIKGPSGAGATASFTLSEGDAVAEVAPGRGGLVTRWAVGADEVLFLDRATFEDLGKNVRGGVPLLFPFAGKAPGGSSLPQHGFARKKAWSARDDGGALALKLTDDDETRAAFPFAFELGMRVTLGARTLGLEWTFENRADQPMPLHFGIHPYFRVGDKAKVTLSGARGTAFDNTTGQTVQRERVDFSQGEVDLHFHEFVPRSTVLSRGGAGADLEVSWTEPFGQLVVWTLPGQPFVCVEPWTAKGQQPSPHVVPARSRRTASITFTLR